MNRLSILIPLSLLFSNCWLVHGAVVQGPVFNPSNGHMYYLLSRNTWTASEEEAERLGGHLATIRNSAEQSWIFRTFGEGFGGGRLLWIGLQDAGTEGTFAWSSGDTNNYRFWAPGEPNNSSANEDYVAIYYDGHSAEGRWNDWGNISADPIGISFMGVAEVPPENFTRPLREPVLIDFEGLRGMPFQPQPAPASVRLSNQLRFTRGVSFTSGDSAVAVVNLGAGHAVSGTNGIGGISNGSLNYSATIAISFSLPEYPEVPASTDFVSVRLDQLGGGPTVRMTAYDLNGAVVGSTNVSDIGGRVLSLSGAGIHRVEIQGNGTAALDDLFFNGLSAEPELGIRREGVQLRVAWSGAFEGAVLEATTDLAPPVTWEPVGVAVESNGSERFVVISASEGQRFFRLQHQ